MTRLASLLAIYFIFPSLILPRSHSVISLLFPFVLIMAFAFIRGLSQVDGVVSLGWRAPPQVWVGPMVAGRPIGEAWPVLNLEMWGEGATCRASGWLNDRGKERKRRGAEETGKCRREQEGKGRDEGWLVAGKSETALSFSLRFGLARFVDNQKRDHGGLGLAYFDRRSLPKLKQSIRTPTNNDNTKTKGQQPTAIRPTTT